MFRDRYLCKNKRYIKTFIKEIMVITFLLNLLIYPETVHSQGIKDKRVLILNSYDSAYSWTNNEVDGIVEQIKDYVPEVNIHIEYMDWKNYPEEHNVELFKELIKYKYGKMNIDEIITTDDSALEFVINNRNDLFKDVPIIFSGVYEDVARHMIKGHDNITGVFESIDAKGTIESALNIIPKAKNIYLIHDNTETGIGSFDEVKNALNEIGRNINLVQLNNISIDDLDNTLPEIDKDSIVLLSSYTRDINEKTLDVENMTRLLSSKIHRPIFQLYEMNLGYGTLGGSLLTAEGHGKDAGKMAARILNGEKAGDIPLNSEYSTESIYDYNVMQMYDISEKDLPAGSIIINEKPSMYKKYKKLIWIVISIILLLVSLVVIMLINIISRKKAEKKLIKNNYELSELYEELAASDEELRTQYEQLEENKEVIQKNEEMYRLIFETTNDGIWEINLETSERYFSERWHKIFELPIEKTVDMDKWFELVHPEDYYIAKNSIEEIASGCTDSFSCSYRILTSSGEYKWIHARGKSMRDNNGKPFRIVGSHSDIHDKKIHEEKIKQMAFFDNLTGLANRTQFVNNFNEIITKSDSNALIFMDLDNFKNINDSFGHTIGDKLLIEIANRIKKCTKDSDIVARLGGDEFLILITNVYEKQSVELYLNNMLEELRNSIVINGINIITSASFGAALYSKDGDTFEELFKNADTAMYKAKESGKRNYVFFEQWMNDDIVEMVIMEDNLRTALENNEFILHYQPKYNPYDSKIDGFEALIRWNNPNLGLVSPFKFIGIAEKTGLIIPIGRWVLENACNFVKSLHNKGEKNISVAVNVSVIQLVQKDFIDMVNDIIERSGVDPRYINIEITESILMESIETNISKINELKKIGVKISLDDFGKGYSSLTYLKDIPFDTLKIDKLFVDELCNEKSDNAIVGTIIKLAHQMNLEVVAEGVESEEQYRYLINNNCDLIQGYYISKPISVDGIQDVLKKYNK